MSKIKNGGLDQYGTEPFEQKQFGTVGIEGVKVVSAGYRLPWQRPNIAHNNLAAAAGQLNGRNDK